MRLTKRLKKKNSRILIEEITKNKINKKSTLNYHRQLVTVGLAKNKMCMKLINLKTKN